MTNPEEGAFPSLKFPIGLTKREYFAAMAMQGMLAGSQGLDISTTQFAEQACVLAYALIKELSK